MKSILITGGLGFLGSHSAELWKSKGWDVTVVDNLSSNMVTEDELTNQGIEVVLKKSLSRYRWATSKHYDMILHCAYIVGMSKLKEYAGRMGIISAQDLHWCMEGAKKFDCPLIFVSSAEVYGTHEALVNESTNKIIEGVYSLRHEYPISKLLCEVMLSATSKVSNLKYHIVRPFNIGGRRQAVNGGVLPIFANKILTNQDIEIHGDGEQIRNFTHVADVAEAIYMIATSDFVNDIWNIANPNNTITINGIANKMKARTNSDTQIKHITQDNVLGVKRENTPDVMKLLTLGWNPKYDMDAIIDDVLEYYSSKL